MLQDMRVNPDIFFFLKNKSPGGIPKGITENISKRNDCLEESLLEELKNSHQVITELLHENILEKF